MFKKRAWLWGGWAALVIAALGNRGVLAQTPTPFPTPTATILDTPGGVIVVYPSMTQGEAALLVAMVLMIGLLLLLVAMQVIEWQRS